MHAALVLSSTCTCMFPPCVKQLPAVIATPPIKAGGMAKTMKAMAAAKQLTFAVWEELADKIL